MSKFLVKGRSTFTAMIPAKTTENVLKLIKKADALGADAFGVQTELLPEEMHNIEVYRKITECANGKPVYATHYIHLGETEPKISDEYAATQFINLAKGGAQLIDIPGDLFCHEVGELTENKEAIEKQMALIDQIHALGKEVLISSHTLRYETPQRVMEIAGEHKRRGADISKIVTFANTIEEEMENLKTTTLLKKELGLPFLFLSGGMCHFHRTIGPMLGCDMWLCVPEQNDISTQNQPELEKMKLIYENFNCTPTDKNGEMY